MCKCLHACGRHPQQKVISRQSLLQRLLAKEIRQEHSYLLQSFRFMVNNNFLQDADTTELVHAHAAEPSKDLRAGEGMPHYI